VSLVAQFRRIEASLPEDWTEARLALITREEGECARAAALLGPANPVRRGRRVRVYTSRHGSGMRPDALRRLLARLDAEGIEAKLELEPVSTRREAPPGPEERREALADAWDDLVAGLPDDWSDLYVELELTSTDHLEPAALRLAPVNPARYGGELAFRFRCARRFGYGASPGMVRRCLERLDEAGIPGRIRILRALSDTQPVGTQGPVWLVGGRSV
jgi:hypothetical protein